MRPQLMQLLNLKHCFDTTNALAVLLLAAAAAAGGVVIADNWSSQRLGKRTLQIGQVLSVVACIVQFQ